MALEKRGKYWYGESPGDIRTELQRYAKGNDGIDHFAAPTCACGKAVFGLQLDDTEGAAIRRCVACDAEHPIGDSADFLADATLDDCTCPCGKAAFELVIGVGLYAESEDVKWIYIGCRCVSCGLTACYGDWKNEFEDYRKLLARV